MYCVYYLHCDYLHCNYKHCVYYVYFEFFQINIVFELWFTFLLGMGWNGYGGEMVMGGMTKGKNFMGGMAKMTRHQSVPSCGGGGGGVEIVAYTHVAFKLITITLPLFSWNIKVFQQS